MEFPEKQEADEKQVDAESRDTQEVASEPQVASSWPTAVAAAPVVAAVVATPVEAPATPAKAAVAAVVEEGPLKELSPEQALLPWYAVHTYAGFEGRVKLSLEERVRSAGLQECFGNIVVPQETVVELIKGQKKTSSRKLFPSYILIQMLLNDETWHIINETPKVTGFVGDARHPMPLTKEEVNHMIEQIKGGGQRPKPKVSFEEGDAVKVVDGPFAEFNGTVDEVKPDKGKLRVLISIFGRNTPVELDFVQVEKV